MRLNISHKIFGIAVILLILMIAAAVVSVYMIGEVRHEMDRIALRRVPATEAVGRVMAGMLNQSVILQRFFVLDEERATNPEAVAGVRREFDALTTRISQDIDGVRALFATSGGAGHGGFREPGTRIEAIAAHYQAYLKEAEALVLALEVGDDATFEALLSELDVHEDNLEREAARFRAALEALSEAALAKADRHETLVLYINVALTCIAAVLGYLFAAAVARRLVNSVRNLVTGTLAVEEGKLDTAVTKTSEDEVGYLTESFNRMVGELRLKERIKDTFGKYLDPRVVTRLLDAPEIAEPGGERRVMTVMFIDLKGFTAISELLPADDLVRLINRFFNHMTAAIGEHDGVVDKFMGDAVMAFWGPPFTAPDAHAALACRAARAAVARLAVFRTELAQELGEVAQGLEIDLRIGISTGEMVVGTVGSDASKSFTVVGDPVNLGSRLEGANKAYGTHILVSDETRLLVDADDLQFREIDQLRVKGKTEPVRIFELLADDTALNAEMVGAFERGLEEYRERRWDESEDAFGAVLAAASDDAPSRTYLDRICHFRQNPPAAAWDGVWVLEVK